MSDPDPLFHETDPSIRINIKMKRCLVVNFFSSTIGIKKPNHRKKLKAAAEELDVGDGLPDHVPRGLQELIQLLRLQEYTHTLSNQVGTSDTKMGVTYL